MKGGSTVVPIMGTILRIEAGAHAGEAVERAVSWFQQIEAACTRFDSSSELRRLGERIGEPVKVSPLLFEALRFSLAVAAETDGAFDPTVGVAMAERGYDRNYQTRLRTKSVVGQAVSACYRDIQLNDSAQTAMLLKPLMLDLGAVAKGLAIDMAVKELGSVGDFLIDAGGDVFAGGRDPSGADWTIGIVHPRQAATVIEVLRVSDCAVCTSGDYERGAHLLDARRGGPAVTLASATVIASSALVADALATAAFALGPEEGLAFLERQGVEGILYTPELKRYATRGMAAYTR
jgi:thiamine biosynthesis lipoprotein